jgi:glycine/D-amino acid oxidase-like deaminating enzyme
VVAQTLNKRIEIEPPKPEATPSGWYLTSGPDLPLNVQKGDMSCDVLVIGAGWMGLHAARRYAELRPQAKVVLVDAGRIGNNASGRCMGFAINLSHNPRKRDFLEDEQGNRDEFHVNTEGTEYLRTAVEELGVDGDWDPQGKYHAAASDSGVADLVAFAKALDSLKEPYSWVSREQMQELTGSKHYIRAIHQPGTVLLQPAKYLKNMARKLPSNVTVYEDTPVISAQFGQTQHSFGTAKGTIRAKKVILCTAAHLQKFGFYAHSAIPVYTYASMTRPLTPSELKQVGNQETYGLIPANSFGTTVRRTFDNRIYLRNVYNYADHFTAPLDKVMQAREQQQVSFDRRWPELSSMGFEASWGGMFTLSQNGGMVWGELAPNVYGAAYCNGTGVARGTAFGKAIAELAAGENSRSIEILKKKAPPSRAYPDFITSLGVNITTGWRFKKAGIEV